jgi:hypothetical protein
VPFVAEVVEDLDDSWVETGVIETMLAIVGTEYLMRAGDHLCIVGLERARQEFVHSVADIAHDLIYRLRRLIGRCKSGIDGLSQIDP